MSSDGLTSIDHAVHTANNWLADVARAFGTDDRQYAYRVTRTWLHALRDRLPTNTSAHFAAQLPELLRGMYYDGWDPAKVPVKYHRETYLRRFADDARIPLTEVQQAARTVAVALGVHLSPGTLDTVFGQLPQDLRELIEPVTELEPVSSRGSEGAGASQERLTRLEERVRVLTEALRTLTQGLEETPVAEPAPDRGARAARLAHEILLSGGTTPAG